MSGRVGVMEPYDESGFQKVNRKNRSLDHCLIVLVSLSYFKAFLEISGLPVEVKVLF